MLSENTLLLFLTMFGAIFIFGIGFFLISIKIKGEKEVEKFEYVLQTLAKVSDGQQQLVEIADHWWWWAR